MPDLITRTCPLSFRCLAAGMPGPEASSGKKKRRGNRVAEEEAWSADTTCFNVRLSSLAIVLLQVRELGTSVRLGTCSKRKQRL